MSMSKSLALELAQRVQRIKPSPTLSILARAEELQANGKNIINLSVGEPDFDTPEHIKEAAIKALHDGRTKYTAVEGIRILKDAVINKFKHENHLDYESNQIIVSCGAKHSIYNIFLSILNPGDEVIIPAPYWVSYPDMVKLTDGNPVILKTDFNQQFKVNPAQLQAAITEHTRAIILNSPSNPTGLAYTKTELQDLGEVILQHPGILVISDDIYEHTLWNNTPFTNIVNACPALYERTMVVNGVAKAYAMTGWRIGYTAGPASIIAAMKKVQSQSTSNPNSIAQYATVAALEGDQEFVRSTTLTYKDRHDFILKALKGIQGIECTASDGTFYTFPNIEGLLDKKAGINNDLALSEYLLTEAEIAVVPGSAFGAPGHIRLSYAANINLLAEAAKRLQSVFQKLYA